MPTIPPTSRTVAHAIRHHRELRGLSRDELSYLIAANAREHDLQVDDIREIEDGLAVVSVDDLVAIAFALDVSPAVLLSHIPIEMPVFEEPIATGVPDSLSFEELREWTHGRISVDRGSRQRWWRSRVTDLTLRVTHLDDQIQGAHDQIEELDDQLLREGAPIIEEIEHRITELEHDLRQSELSLQLAEHRLAEMTGAPTSHLESDIG